MPLLVMAIAGVALALLAAVASLLLWREHRRAKDAARQERTATVTAEQLTMALTETEARYRLLADNVRDIIALQDSRGVMVYLSPAVESILGYSPDVLRALWSEELVHPDDRASYRRAREEVQHGSGMGESTHRVRHRDGTWVWIESCYRRMAPAPGEPPGILISARDITKRKQVEAQFLQAQKLEGIGQLAGGIAHDFNNLLTAVLGYAEAATELLPVSHPAVEFLGEIQASGQRAAALTKQLLTFSRRHVVQPELVDLNVVLLQMDRLLQRVIGEDVELVTRTGSQLPTVQVDEGQIGQVLLNLALNARDAMPGGGRLTIDTSVAELDHAYASQHAGVTPGTYVLLAVTDTGTGIPSEVAAHMFEPFYTTKSVGKGTGLGLASCFGIVTAAGGHLWYYTEAGAGTTFKVYLPVADGVAAAQRAAAEGAVPGGHETVLVVEDESSVRTLAVHFLRGMGYTVLEAENGEVALQLASGGSPAIDLVISDVIMPHLGGPAMADRLRATRPDARVLFLSGYTGDSIAGTGALAKGDGFLQKPFTRAGLAQAVRKALAAG